MTLTKGQRIVLDVVGDSYGYYTLNLDGKNIKVKKFNFQRYDKVPERLSCIVDRVDGNNIYLKQDMAPIFASRYKPGECYDFIVEKDMTMTPLPHYRVRQEEDDYWILLPAKRGLKLSHGDRVRCRVGKLKGINLNLHIEEVLDRHGEPPVVLIKPTELAAHAGEEAYSVLMETLTEHPRMVKARQMLKDGNPEWVLEALRAGRDQLLASGHTPDKAIVTTLRSVAAYILEDSTLLGAFPNHRRIMLREEIARLVSHCDDMLTALDIVADGRQSEYISDMMAKLSASGYLYRPESKLRTLMCVFSLDPDSIDAKMTELISIIHKGSVTSWLAEPFRSAFVEQLQLYIDSCHTILDNISDVDGEDTESRLDKMLAALSIQQILAADRNAPASDMTDNMVINRSRLYRYFSFKSTCPKQTMLEKSLQVAVTGDIPEKEFSWDDTKDLGRLARKLVANQSLDSSNYVFAAPNASLSVSADSIDLRISGPEASHSVIPQSLDLWHGLQVWLDESLPPANRHPSTILQFRETFALVRMALRGDSYTSPGALRLSEKPKSRSKQKGAEATERKEQVRMLPDPGDLVDIVVEPVQPGEVGSERFVCRVVEDGFRGTGYLDRSNITRGNGPIPLSAFFDEENRPYKFRARVMACSSIDDSLSFSIIDELNRYINLNVEPGTELNGVVTAQPSPANGFNSNRYTVLTEHGYTAWVDAGEFADNLRNGDIISLRIDSVSKAARADIMATCTNGYLPDEKVTFEDAFSTLIYSYADGEVLTDSSAAPAPVEADDDDADSAGQIDEPLSETRVEELMLIIARTADLEKDMVKAYCYFCFAGLLAEILDLEHQAKYYAGRCSIIEVLDEFGSNGRVDLARVDSLSSMIIGSSASSLEAQQLKLLAVLDRPDRTDTLWDVIRTTSSDRVEKLGRLILAYNALDGFKLGRERLAIREEIYNVLNLMPDTLPQQIEDGHESQTVEFKTSLIYPAGNSMRRDVRRQTREILQIIDGFLNSSGGTLYIGVSDEGYVRGVATDLEFFKAPDKMDLHLLNAIDKELKMVDRFLFIQTSWRDYDGKSVYVVDVKPSRTPVALEGVYFQRHGTTTRYLSGDMEAEFLAARRDGLTRPAVKSTGKPKAIEAPAEAPAPTPGEEDSTPAPAPAPAVAPAPEPVQSYDAETRNYDEGRLPTSERRDNRHYDTCDGTPFHEPVSFFYITDEDGSYRLSSDPLWIDDESRLTLRMREDEAEADLIAVFKSGHGLRLDYQRLEPQGRISGGELAYLTPARPTDGLFIYYSTDDGRNVVKRFFPAESLRRGSVYEQGERLLPPDSVFLRAIVIEQERAAAFARFERNGQRLSGGMADLESDYTRSLTYHL